MKLAGYLSLLLQVQYLAVRCNGFMTPSSSHQLHQQQGFVSQADTSTFLRSSPDTTEEVKLTKTTKNDEKEVNPRKVGLALQLDDGTRKSHSMAQNTAFVTGFFKGLANRQSYGALLKSLYFVYDAMEKAMDETDESRVQQLDLPELRRVSSLERDLQYFYGSGGDSSAKSFLSNVQPSAATRAYVARIEQVAETKPYLLIAHQYTRYLGDLFGGQMMGGMATSSLGLSNGEGTAFYKFDQIPSTQDFITKWYKLLNGLDLTEEQKQEIVDEANLVFDLNVDILQELEGSPFQAFTTLVVNRFKELLGFA